MYWKGGLSVTRDDWSFVVDLSIERVTVWLGGAGRRFDFGASRNGD